MKEFAQELRRNSTDAEKRLWRHLKNRLLRGHKFRRQHPVPPYIADFACLESSLIVELDGGQHVEQAEYDAMRTSYLMSKGFKVIRFWDDDVLLKTDDVLEEILRNLDAPHPGPLPAGGARE